MPCQHCNIKFNTYKLLYAIDKYLLCMVCPSKCSMSFSHAQAMWNQMSNYYPRLQQYILVRKFFYCTSDTFTKVPNDAI